MKQTNKALKAKIAQLEKRSGKIGPNGFFATPKDMKALMDYCNSFSGRGEKQIAMTCAVMAWNLACKAVNS